MTPCPACVPWNMPVTMPARFTPCGVGLLFQEWIAYHLHILHHQSPDSWGGEIDGVSALLRSDPGYRLEAMVRLAA